MSKSTHIALPVNVARAARAVLGKLPHDEMHELLSEWDAKAVGVTVDQKPEQASTDG